MRVLDPGHQYALTHLDGNLEELLTFVKRKGEGYPGNVGSHPGTNIQEVLRALIDRMKYLDGQIPHWRNKFILDHLRTSLENLEYRAAERHRRILFLTPGKAIEDHPVCGLCGHIGCNRECVAAAQ